MLKESTCPCGKVMLSHQNKKWCSDRCRGKVWTPKVCPCGTVMYHTNRKYCSDECYDKAQDALKTSPCPGCGGLMWGKTLCNSCRRSAHGYTGYRNGCRCDICRSANNAEARAYRAEHRKRTGVPPGSNKSPEAYLCAYCGCPIKYSILEKPACSKCKDKKKNNRVSADLRRKRLTEKLEKASEGVSPDLRFTFVQGSCHYCGEKYLRRVMTGRLQAFCSAKCSRASKSSWVTKRDRIAVYERDGWVCQLCFAPVEKSLPHSDSWSATLDHIECQSWVLVPDHRPSNLRLAHRWCNGLRGDNSADLDLISFFV